MTEFSFSTDLSLKCPNTFWTKGCTQHKKRECINNLSQYVILHPTKRYNQLPTNGLSFYTGVHEVGCLDIIFHMPAGWQPSRWVCNTYSIYVHEYELEKIWTGRHARIRGISWFNCSDAALFSRYIYIKQPSIYTHTYTHTPSKWQFN